MRSSSLSRHETRRSFMALRAWLGVCFAIGAICLSGCAGTADDGAPSTAKADSGGGKKNVVFVGFDASEPLVDAMRQGKIQGLVVQNPILMGATSVETMVRYLEKQP